METLVENKTEITAEQLVKTLEPFECKTLLEKLCNCFMLFIKTKDSEIEKLRQAHSEKARQLGEEALEQSAALQEALDILEMIDRQCISAKAMCYAVSRISWTNNSMGDEIEKYLRKTFENPHKLIHELIEKGEPEEAGEVNYWMALIQGIKISKDD